MTEEDEEHDDDEGHAEEQVLEHRVRRHFDELAAVVVGNELHPGREQVVLADVLEPLVHAFQGVRRLSAVAHEDDALDDVRVVVVADDAEARREADLDVRDVLHANGDARGLAVHGRLGHDDVLDVVDVADEADAADVVRLLADDEALAADVGVGVADRLDDLGERDALAAQPVGVDLHVVLLRLAAVARDVDDAVDLLELALEEPVLRRLQITEGVALASQRVAKDFTDGVPR